MKPCASENCAPQSHYSCDKVRFISCKSLQCVL
nr:MAG TPA: hypothetical protein [Ackermannviridae sp.]